jgi:hypothetical protein
MLLLLEIGLTVAAWHKGWRGRALLPLGVLVGVALLIGAAVGASGGSVHQARPVLFLLDLACIGVLIGMAVRTPEHAELRDTTKDEAVAEETVDGAKA